MARKTGGVVQPTFPIAPDDYEKEDESRFRRLVEQFCTSASGAFTALGEDIGEVEDSIPDVPDSTVHSEAWNGDTPIEAPSGGPNSDDSTHTLPAGAVTGTYRIAGWVNRDRVFSGDDTFEFDVFIDPDGESGETLVFSEDVVVPGTTEDNEPFAIDLALEEPIEPGGTIRVAIEKSVSNSIMDAVVHTVTGFSNAAPV